jgi:spermidine/putrescine transport system permease protein
MRRLRPYSVPYLIWMGLFIIVPTLILILLGFSNLALYDIGLFDMTLEHFAIFTQTQIISALWNSLMFASLTTLICFIAGYPIAYYLSTLKAKTRKILMAMMIVPLWSNMLLRIIAWEKIFTPSSILTDLLGISFDLLGTEVGVLIGMVAMYLPFMIFPIFSVLEKMDVKLIEAAKDLGASDLQTFTRVTFPLSSGGVVSGVIMTMLPAMTAFVLPARIGLGKINLIGNIIESKFMKEVLGSSEASINEGALISLLLMVFSVISFVTIIRVDKEGETLI